MSSTTIRLSSWKSLDGRPSAVVSGASSGLGRSMSVELCSAGWRVAMVDMDSVRLREATEQVNLIASKVLHGCLPEATAHLMDVRDASAWTSLSTELRSKWTSLELLVNSAGVGATGYVGTLGESQWRRVIDTNLIGTALGCETFMPWLRSHPVRSHLVNIASIAAILSPPTMSAYAASKAGVVALSEAIMAENKNRRPGVTVVCPGFFRSSLLESWHFTSARERVEADRRMTSASRSSDDIAKIVLHAMNTGRFYVVEGRRARWLWRLKRLAPLATTRLIQYVWNRAGRPTNNEKG